jgi:hypothetical protein
MSKEDFNKKYGINNKSRWFTWIMKIKLI